jgi:hypothetical protein
MQAQWWICALLMAATIRSSESAAILLSLLKELQKESQTVTHLAGLSSQWCADAEHLNSGMVQAIQGQLDDATIAMQQIMSDERRLHSEVSLSKSTQSQREQQLQDAVATSKFAAAEFASEQDQLAKTITAAQHAMRLVKAQMQMDTEQQQQLGNADVAVNNLLQTSADHITDDEKNIMSDFASDAKDSQGSGERPQQLLQTLTNLHARLVQEQKSAYAEHQVMALRLWSFTDHLNSSIMESKSQAASISMEMAQRKREHTRLGGKITSLNALLNKVEASVKAVGDSCSAESQYKAAIQKLIEDESYSVSSTLKKMPQLSSELLFDLNAVLPQAPTFPSFLQLRGGHRQQAKAQTRDPISPILKDLAAMANKFSDDSSAFVDAEQTVQAQRSVPEEKPAAGKKPQDGINGFASSSIQDIYAFLKSDEQGGGGAQLPGEERMLLSNSGDLNRVTGVYQNLLDNVHSKEKAVDDQLKWCSSIARDAKVDSDAVARSLKWTGAKLNLVKVALSEYEGTIAYNKQQQTAITDRDLRLKKLYEVEDHQLRQSSEMLKTYGQQLLSLIGELNQKSTPEERKGAEIVRGLMDKLEKHEGLLQQWRGQNKETREAVESTSSVVQRSLADGIKQANRRLVRLKVESQVLTSLSSSKAKDKELSEQYVSLSEQLCSTGHAKQLQMKGKSLRREEAAIQKSLNALSQPAA